MKTFLSQVSSIATTVALAVTALAAPASASASTPASAGPGHSPAKHSHAAPLVIGHRGAAGYRPEHTLAGYELAARMGADFIEPDLVSTKDHVLIVRHENDITGTTNVSEVPAFAGRKATKKIDGRPVTGWFTEDFTLAEIKTLRAKERLPELRQENTIYDGLYQIPTFDEVLQLRSRLSKELHRTIGVYPETKHPTYFRSVGLELETPLVRALARAGLTKATSPVFVQSFEITNLIALRLEYKVKVKLVFLTGATGAPYDLVSKGDPRTYADLTTPARLAQLAKVINGIGPDKAQIIPRDAAGNLGTPTSLVRDAHAVGLLVHPYTFRAENAFLPVDYRRGTNPADFGRILDEIRAYLNTGIDGFFTDQADIGVAARDAFVSAA